MITAPTVKLPTTSVSSIQSAPGGKGTHKMSAIKSAKRRPSLSARLPRMEAPKMAPMVHPAVMISCSPCVRGLPRSSPTCGKATPMTAVSYPKRKPAMAAYAMCEIICIS